MKYHIQVSWNPLLGTRTGEASHPGPSTSHQQFTFAILNPTVLTDRQQDILDLQADTISLAETSATVSIQNEFTKFIQKTNYRVSWSPPVSPHRESVNPMAMDSFRRGEALGTASLHRTPHRPSRNPFPGHLSDTLWVSQEVVRLGHFEVLLVTAFFFAGRTAHIRAKSDSLLADIYMHCALSNMPFIVAADFNHPVREFPAYRAFQAVRCQEAFHFAQQRFNKDLPPTCRNATKNDSFIIHEALVPFITVHVGGSR